MKKKINILIGDEAKKLGKYYGFWNQFILHKKELLDNNLEINFFHKIDKNFLDGNFLFLHSRLFPSVDQLIDLEYLKKIREKNENLFWFDMRDSAGTTQFEVLPYVKKYIKKQFYKDKDIYLDELRGGRFYTDYYIKNNQVKDNLDYKLKTLEKKFLHKLVLGWNLGISFIFDYNKYNKLDYYRELIKFNFFKNPKFSMKLENFSNWENDDLKYDFICLLNKNFYRNSVIFQRKKLLDKIDQISKYKKLTNIRLKKNEYYKALRNAKVSIGAYGWGEVCYREFEAIQCGTAIMFPDMSNIETWPNIYIDNETYISYDLDFINFEEKLKKLIMDFDLRKKLVNNSKDIMNDVYKNQGKDYFINKVFEIISS